VFTLTKRIACHQGVETDDGNKTNLANFKDRLRKWYANDASRKVPEVRDTDKSAGGASRGRGSQVIRGDDDAKPMNKWVTDIRKVAGRLQPETTNPEGSCQPKDPDLVKLALIDDGVDPEWDGSGTLGSFLSGVGYPPDMPNWAVAGPRKHGNRMARLITDVCPFVSLYVAKIDSNTSREQKHPTFDIGKATKAILWAIQKEVEVISISWNALLDNTDTRTRDLDDALTKAERKGILIFCATRPKDDVTGVKKAWPAACDKVFRIGAAHIHLGTQGLSGRDAHYHFPSQDVLEDVVSGGTSAATALAAGLASLFVYNMKKNQRNILNDEEDKRRRLPPAQEDKTGQDKTNTVIDDDTAAGRNTGNNKQHGNEVKDCGTEKGVEPSLLALATNKDPKSVLEKTFDRLNTGEIAGTQGKYVDVGVLAGWDTVSPATISDYCTSHLAKRRPQMRRDMKK